MRLQIGPRAYLTGRATLAQPSPAPSCLPVRQARWLGGGAYRSLGSSATRASPSRCAPRASIRARPTPMTRRDASLLCFRSVHNCSLLQNSLDPGI